MYHLAEFLALSFVFVIFGVTVTIYSSRNNKKHIISSPVDIAMIRILYMYQDFMQERNPKKKITKLEKFEDTLLDFISKYEEEVSSEDLEFVKGNVKSLNEFRKKLSQ